MATANDLTIYERHANEWWDERSPTFRSLHTVNEFRVALLEDWLGSELDRRIVVDLGCGGGLLARPLASAGARVVGIDTSPRSLRAASEKVGHRFVCADALRTPLASGSADVVLLADVIEHLADPSAALREAARLLRRGGVCFVSTINRTRRAKWLAVRLAEGIGLMPRGTHDSELFITPDELRVRARACGLELEALQGESIDLWRTVRRWAITLERSADLSVGYSALFCKASAP
jgi:2-polyprenyl-6-hydroxyphenyl methylase / 3-demethylubiquinone-9 3-methyltransferase